MIVKLADVDVEKLKIAKQLKDYGQYAKVQYADYDTDMTKLDVCLGPYRAPYGVSCFNGAIDRSTLVLDVSEDIALAGMMAGIDAKFRKSGISNKEISGCCDAMFRVHIPTFRGLEADEAKFRTTFFVKEYEKDGYTPMLTNVNGLKAEELCALFSGNHMYYVVARLVGCVYSNLRSGCRWEAMQIVMDKTAECAPTSAGFVSASLDMFM